MSLRFALLWVVALIALFVIGAPTAVAGDDSGLAEPAADTTSAPPTPIVEPAPQAAPVPEVDQSGDTSPGSGVTEGSAAGEGTTPPQQTSERPADPSQAVDPNADVGVGDGVGPSPQPGQGTAGDPQTGSGATAEQAPANAAGAEQALENEAVSEASNEAEVEQHAQQEQSGGSGGGGLVSGGDAQVQQAEQNAEITQEADSQAVGEQQATDSAQPLPPPATDPAQPLPPPTTDVAQVDWSAIHVQLPLAGGIEGIVALAQNGSLVLQAIWQVQHGCSSHCTRTSQSQSATQHGTTTQDATAIADGDSRNEGGESSGGASAPSTAEARNRSVTVQFVWQTQIGCVAFCFETSLMQTAIQWAQTNQSATAEGGTGALAENLSETVQLVWQLQQGCQQECHGTSQVQVINQGQETTQSAAADVVMPVLGADGAVVLPAWLVGLARNLGVTIQTIYQLQEAVCAEHCVGDSQLQDALQRAEVSQEAAAYAGEPPVPVDEPPVEVPAEPEPPPAHPPVEQPGPATEPATRPNRHVALAAISDPSSPAARRLRSQLTELASKGGESRLRSLVLVLPAKGPAPLAKRPAITEETLTAPLTALASDSGSRRPPKSPAGNGSDTSWPTTLSAAPDGTTNGGGSGGWLWIVLLAASLALLPKLRQLRRISSPGRGSE
jgi:hypothetical protein